MERGQTLLKTGRAAVNSQRKLALKLGRRKDGSEMMTGGGERRCDGRKGEGVAGANAGTGVDGRRRRQVQGVSSLLYVGR